MSIYSLLTLGLARFFDENGDNYLGRHNEIFVFCFCHGFCKKKQKHTPKTNFRLILNHGLKPVAQGDRKTNYCYIIHDEFKSVNQVKSKNKLSLYSSQRVETRGAGRPQNELLLYPSRWVKNCESGKIKK